MKPSRIFTNAEALDPVDTAIIEVNFGSPLRQIYMATQRLFAVNCRLGNLHLAEDSVMFEYEPVGNGLVSPLVACFQRETQIMARYRMNDLQRLATMPSPCGSHLQHVSEIVGRMNDAFHIDGCVDHARRVCAMLWCKQTCPLMTFELYKRWRMRSALLYRFTVWAMLQRMLLEPQQPCSKLIILT